MDYEKIYTLKHNEIPAKINAETGEVKSLLRLNNLPQEKVVLQPSSVFIKRFDENWTNLSKELSTLEFNMAYKLSQMVDVFTNKLPYTDFTPWETLQKDFDISRHKMSETISKFLHLGVIREIDSEWYFNPSLSRKSNKVPLEIYKAFTKGIKEERANPKKQRKSLKDSTVTSIGSSQKKATTGHFLGYNESLVDVKTLFSKDFPDAWAFLIRELSEQELKVAILMSLKASMNGNILKPLTDDTTVLELVQEFGVSKNNINPIIKKLFEYGVYSKSTVHNIDGMGRYWTLNPFLSFKGKLFDRHLAEEFKKTHVGKAHFDNKHCFKKPLKEAKIPDFILHINERHEPDGI